MPSAGFGTRASRGEPGGFDHLARVHRGFSVIAAGNSKGWGDVSWPRRTVDLGVDGVDQFGDITRLVTHVDRAEPLIEDWMVRIQGGDVHYFQPEAYIRRCFIVLRQIRK